MEVEKLPLPQTPIWILDEFLAPKDAAKCLRECIGMRRAFMPASVGSGQDNRIDPAWRQNDVIMLDTVFAADRSRSDILTLVDRRINTEPCRTLWNQGYRLFDTINYRTWNESVLSRYGNCNFYGRHQDTIFNKNASNETRRRLVTLVLYFNVEPEPFKGGELTIWDTGDPRSESVKITPKHNRAVVFPSFAHHKVDKVELPKSAPFSAGRFSLNRWMGFL